MNCIDYDVVSVDEYFNNLGEYSNFECDIYFDYNIVEIKKVKK